MESGAVAGFKCHFCNTCDGSGCVGEMPGMGGFNNSVNFQLNCAGWGEIPSGYLWEATSDTLPTVRLAPITGGVENIGYKSERDWYFDMIHAAHQAGVALCIGDGCPDTKLQWGIEAVKAEGAKAAVFIKPYDNSRIMERMEWAEPVAEYIGVDIDAYNIVTMRSLVKLERKSAEQMLALKKAARHPLMIKGVFTERDLELVEAVRPDVVVISNHGGRVENRIGSTAQFLFEHGAELKRHCGELWVDGGLRSSKDIAIAGVLGATQVMVGRPFISALCRGGAPLVRELYERLL